MNRQDDIDAVPIWPDPENRPRLVLAAMSGGVDSAFAAWILARAGVEVIGVHFKMGDFEDPEDSTHRCCSRQDTMDARGIADLLGIRLYVVSLIDKFREQVILPFAGGYARGETPNPCIICNPAIKWRTLVEMAAKISADAVATGHHARVVRDANNGRTALLTGLEAGKDQSYFLARLPAEYLERAILPAGWFQKDGIRKALADAGLPVAMKRESQDVCFMDRGGSAATVEKYLAGEIPAPGEIVDASGKVLGAHPGIHHFTIGQRKGLNLPGPRPCYVLDMDAASGRIVVGTDKETRSGEAFATGLHWIHEPPRTDNDYGVKIRYQAPILPSRIFFCGPDRIRIVFNSPQRAVTPGQAAVIYRGNEVLGCGAIIRPKREEAERPASQAEGEASSPDRGFQR